MDLDIPDNNGESGGFDYHFVENPPELLICDICHLPSCNPYLSVCCGHLFCKSCIDSAEQKMLVRTCPVCRDEEFMIYPNKQADRAVRSLLIIVLIKRKVVNGKEK